MGLDRFVLFKDDNKPTLEQLKFILEDYLGDIGAKIDYQEACWFVSFPGKPSSPFRRSHPVGYIGAGLHDERWFEVFVGSLDQKHGENMGPNVDIITRFQDEIINNIAEGFAGLLRRFYKATSDEEQEETDEG